MLIVQIALGVVLGGVIFVLLFAYLDKVLIGVVTLLLIVVLVLLAAGNWWAYSAPASDMNHGSGNVIMKLVVIADFLIGWAVVSSVYSYVTGQWQTRGRKPNTPSGSLEPTEPPSHD